MKNAAQRADICALASRVAPRSRARSINPPELYDWVREHTPDRAEAIFIGGNGCRAVGVIEALEQDLQRPVLTANQVLLWRCLRVADVQLKPHGYGRLFDTDPARTS